MSYFLDGDKDPAEDKDLDTLFWDWCRGSEDYPEHESGGATLFRCAMTLSSALQTPKLGGMVSLISLDGMALSKACKSF